jgi:hypothetical protein
VRDRAIDAIDVIDVIDVIDAIDAIDGNAATRQPIRRNWTPTTNDSRLKSSSNPRVSAPTGWPPPLAGRFGQAHE